MATRKIIEIDEAKCNGCGKCVTGCAEGALAIINGKAKVVREQYCDGFGDCVGDCPTGALKLVDREAPEFDETAVRAHLARTRGADGVARFEQAQSVHAGHVPAAAAAPARMPRTGGCPGSAQRMRPTAGSPEASRPTASTGLPPAVNRSELTQWPVQLHLVSPQAPFFKNREVVLLSTCSPIASADVHWRFIRGRSVIVACPKLDRREGYVEKLAEILSEPTIPKVIVVRMEVPCCGGLTAILEEAVELSGRADLAVEEVVVGLDGAVQGARPV